MQGPDPILGDSFEEDSLSDEEELADAHVYQQHEDPLSDVDQEELPPNDPFEEDSLSDEEELADAHVYQQHEDPLSDVDEEELPPNDPLSEEQALLSKRKHRTSSTLDRKIKKPRTHSEGRTHGRNHWSDDEDQKLLEAARAHGFTDGSDGGAAWSPDWGAISAQMDTRSPEQCRRRFTDYLDPTIDHSSLTEEEEQLLVQLVETHGTKWSAISSEMPQTNGRRTGVQLSNTWRRVVGKQQERRPTKALDDAAALEKDGQPEASTAVAEPLGHRPSTTAAVQPSSATDGFESDDWSDSEPMPMSTDAGVADAAGVFEPDDWSGSESDLSTSALNDQRESESEAEEGSAHLVFGEANWHAADVGSDFSSTDSDEDQCDP